MENVIIITKKEDLKSLIKEIILELVPVQNPKQKVSKSEVDFMNIDSLLVFLAENGYNTKKSQIYKLTRTNRIPFIKIGQKLLFSKSDITEWLGSFKK